MRMKNWFLIFFGISTKRRTRITYDIENQWDSNLLDRNKLVCIHRVCVSHLEFQWHNQFSHNSRYRWWPLYYRNPLCTDIRSTNVCSVRISHPNDTFCCHRNILVNWPSRFHLLNVEYCLRLKTKFANKLIKNDMINTANFLRTTNTGHIVIRWNARRCMIMIRLCWIAIFWTINVAKIFWTFNEGTIKCGRLIVIDAGASTWSQMIWLVIGAKHIRYIVLLSSQMTLGWIIFCKVRTFESTCTSYWISHVKLNLHCVLRELCPATSFDGDGFVSYRLH